MYRLLTNVLSPPLRNPPYYQNPPKIRNSNRPTGAAKGSKLRSEKAVGTVGARSFRLERQKSQESQKSQGNHQNSPRANPSLAIRERPPPKMQLPGTVSPENPGNPKESPKLPRIPRLPRSRPCVPLGDERPFSSSEKSPLLSKSPKIRNSNRPTGVADCSKL